jgi:hypothetical protein
VGKRSSTNRVKNEKNITKSHGGKSILHMKNKRRLYGLVTSCEEILIEGNIKGGEDREQNVICHCMRLKKREGTGN